MVTEFNSNWELRISRQQLQQADDAILPLPWSFAGVPALHAARAGQLESCEGCAWQDVGIEPEIG